MKIDLLINTPEQWNENDRQQTDREVKPHNLIHIIKSQKTILYGLELGSFQTYTIYIYLILLYIIWFTTLLITM